MSRSGYIDDDGESNGLWRGAVTRAIKGKRGQALLLETLAALDAMPEKALAAESLVTADGEFCTLGVLGNARGVNIGHIDPDDYDHVAFVFDAAPALVREIVHENDEALDSHYWMKIDLCGPVRPMWPFRERHIRNVRVEKPAAVVAQRRWKYMRKWVFDNLTSESRAALSRSAT